MIPARNLFRFVCLLMLGLSMRYEASATTFTQSGTFTADNSYDLYSFSTSTTQSYTFYTTSFGGGMNLDGTTAAAGGFVPVLSLFNADGSVIGAAGASGTCSGGAKPSGGMCDDAYLQETLAKGSYLLYLTEFPNVANGNLIDGFLFSNDPHATGAVCNQAGGTFLESDVAPCVQRTDKYSLNVTSVSAVPEPPTWALVLPVAGVLFFAGRQHLS